MTKSILRNSEDLQLLDRSLDCLLDAEGHYPSHLTSDNKFYKILEDLDYYMDEVGELIKEENGK